MDWRKIYILGDKKKRKPVERTEFAPVAPKRRRKPWKFWLPFSLFAFGLGLGIGFKEDSQWEEIVEFVGERVGLLEPAPASFPRAQSLLSAGEDEGYGIQERPTQGSDAILRYVLRAYDWKETEHFGCRVQCRNIIWNKYKGTLSDWQVESAAVVDTLNPKYAHDTKFHGQLKYTLTSKTAVKDRRSLTVVLTVDTRRREVRFITAYFSNTKYEPDPCKDETC